MSSLRNMQNVIASGLAAASARVAAGVLAISLAVVLAMSGFSMAAYATIYAVDDAAAASAGQTAAVDDEAIEDDAVPMYSGVPEVIEDDAVPMYSGQPGDPANVLRAGIVAGIFAVAGFYLISTGRLNRNIDAMNKRI